LLEIKLSFIWIIQLAVGCDMKMKFLPFVVVLVLMKKGKKNVNTNISIMGNMNN